MVLYGGTFKMVFFEVPREAPKWSYTGGKQNGVIQGGGSNWHQPLIDKGGSFRVSGLPKKGEGVA